MPIVVNYKVVDDGVIGALEALLAVAKDRVELRAQVREFLDEFPTLAIGEIEHGIATAAGESIARLKCGKDLEVFLAALRANKPDGDPADGRDEAGGPPRSEG